MGRTLREPDATDGARTPAPTAAPSTPSSPRKPTSPAPTAAPTPSPSPTRTPSATPTGANIPFGPAGEGSEITSPLPVGAETVLRSGEQQFTIRVGSLQPDVNGEVRTSDGAGPPEDTRFVLVPVTVSYAGQEPADAWENIRLHLVWTDQTGGVEVLDESTEALAPEDLFDRPTLSDGDSVSGNVPFAMPEDVTGGVIAVVSLTGEPDGDLVYIGPVQGGPLL